jgi:hypothetical protein
MNCPASSGRVSLNALKRPTGRGIKLYASHNTGLEIIAFWGGVHEEKKLHHYSSELAKALRWDLQSFFLLAGKGQDEGHEC